jgi:hypothetical protein
MATMTIEEGHCRTFRSAVLLGGPVLRINEEIEVKTFAALRLSS